MAFREFAGQKRGVELLQRSLERGRLAHAYLFTGDSIEELEGLALTLAKTLNCLQPVRAGKAAIDCCDACLNCRKIEHGNHADVHWVRPESKSRVIVIDQMRALMQEVNLKPTEAEYKVAVIAAADRLNANAANSFLKTLEEPPAKSIFILLTTEPQRLLETILSRCLRLSFSGDNARRLDPDTLQWLTTFSDLAASEQKSLIGRYRLMDVLLQKLTGIKADVEKNLSARSPIEQYEDVEKDLREKWEDELAAGIEAEYRRRRADLLNVLQRWLRDIWLHTLKVAGEVTYFPEVPGGERIAGRITPAEALENLRVMDSTQRLLHSNVQEALALEVGLLKLHL